MAVKFAEKVAKQQKRAPSPVVASGRKMAKSFWGLAWCDNLESYQDYSNRLPRGATYLRNGSVVDLVIKPRLVEAIVAGSTPYKIKIEIQPLKPARWKAIRQDCSESIDSLLDLLSGKLSDGVMKRLTDQKSGLFPAPSEINMECSCPDYSDCCKHLAAVIYGIGTRLDNQPELLFLLRGIDHTELVSQAIASGNLERELSGIASSGLDNNDLEAIFGIELDAPANPDRISKPIKRAKTRAQEPVKSRKAAVVSAKKTVAEKSTGAAPRKRRVVEKPSAKKTPAGKSAIAATRTSRVTKKQASQKTATRKTGTTTLAKRTKKKTAKI